MTYKKIFILIVVSMFLLGSAAYLFPNAHLDTKAVTVGTEELSLFVADEPHERVRGLMNVESLEDGDGMLFLFEKPQEVTFWNKNLLLSLDVIWVRGGVVIGIDSLFPESAAGIQYIYSKGVIDSVIEVPQGWGEQKGITVGDGVSFPQRIF